MKQTQVVFETEVTVMVQVKATVTQVSPTSQSAQVDEVTFNGIRIDPNVDLTGSEIEAIEARACYEASDV